MINPKLYDTQKINLPKRGDYVGCIAWLQAVSRCLGGQVVFALDEALMCQELFLGRDDEYIIWVYGDDTVTKYNGVIVLGNQISSSEIVRKNDLNFTDFNRTLSDALANEDILDMQGITEALSNYYYANNESFIGITVSPKYKDRFNRLAVEAIEYYTS